MKKSIGLRAILLLLMVTVGILSYINWFRPHIEIVIKAEQDDEISVYYDNLLNTDYCFEDGFLTDSYRLKAGWQEVSIPVPAERMQKLRLDFQNEQSAITIEKLVLIPSILEEYTLTAEDISKCFTLHNAVQSMQLGEGSISYTFSGQDPFIGSANDLIAQGIAHVPVSTIWSICKIACFSLLLCVIDVILRPIFNVARPLGALVKRKKYFCIYFLCVTGVLAVCFGWMILHDLLYIYYDIGADTYCSYWPLYSSSYQFLKNNASFWSFSAGLGGNMLDFLSMQLCDPFSLILHLFSYENIKYGIMVVAVVKYYALATISYIYFRKLGLSQTAVTFSALACTFSGYFVSWGQHYQFATGFFCLILCLYGYEVWAKGGSSLIFILSVALVSFFSVYFTYMVLLSTGIYTVFRYFSIHRYTTKHFAVYLGKLLGFVIIGFGISAVMLLPGIYSLLDSSRVSASQGFSPNLASLRYYLGMVLRLFSDSILGINNFYGPVEYYEETGSLNFYEMPFLYVGILFILVIPIAIKKENLGKTGLVATLLIVASLVFVGISGPIFNGFSTITSRWTMCLVPVFCWGLGKTMQDFQNNPAKDCKTCIVSAGVCLVAVPLLAIAAQYVAHQSEIALTTSVMICIILLLLYLVIMVLGSCGRITKAFLMNALLVVLLIDLGSNAFMSMVWERSLISSKEPFYFDNTSEAVQYLEEVDPDFYRIEKSYNQVDLSDSLIQLYHGEKHYMSTWSEEWNTFETEFQLRGVNSNYFYGFDDKQVLRNLMSGKYLLSREPVYRDGYTFLAQIEGINIYRNENAVPLAYLQEHAISLRDIQKESPLEKQDYLLQNFLSEDPELLHTFGADKSIQTLPMYFDVQYSLQRSQQEITGISLKKASQTPVILCFTFDIADGSKVASISGQLHYVDAYGKSYSQSIYGLDVMQRTRMAFCKVEIGQLGITDINWDPFASLTVTSVEVVGRNSQVVADLCEDLNQTDVKTEILTDGMIRIQVHADEDSMLVTSIPYEDGWTATIDGSPVDIHVVNLAFIGVQISRGDCEIILHFVPKGMKVGAYISIGTIVILAGYYLIDHTRKRKLNQ